MAIEKTLLIIKHDGVARGLMGSVISRIERVGLKLIAMEFIQSTEEMGSNHYPNTDKWLSKVGERTLKEYKEKGVDPEMLLGTQNAIEIGRMVKQWLIDYIGVGPVLAMVWEGPNAVAVVRKLVGDTIPSQALAGTIRGDFGIDDPEMANEHKRPIYNIVHASGEVAEATEEIALWFANKEVFDYQVFASKFTGEGGVIKSK